MLKAIATTLVLVCLSLYPFIVYFGLQHVSIKQVSLILIALLAIRLMLSQKLTSTMPWLKPASFLAIVALATTPFFNSELGLRLYPVIINTVMAITFIYSLLQGPTVIESFARLKEPDLDSKGVRYTRQVTKIWSVFFILNGTVALYTSLFASLSMWTLYNGLVAYLLIAILMLVEWLVRQKVKNNGGE
ncbi:putative membrane protein [Pseudoalteromonas sp. MBR-15]|jgi:uncharacterized membrane protein